MYLIADHTQVWYVYGPNSRADLNLKDSPKGPSTQYLRFPVPKTTHDMALGTRVLKQWVLRPSGVRIPEQSTPPGLMPSCTEASPGVTTSNAMCRSMLLKSISREAPESAARLLVFFALLRGMVGFCCKPSDGGASVLEEIFGMSVA